MTATEPQALPWIERDEPESRAATPAPRSRRDLEILRTLARRINANDPGAHNNLGVVYYNKGLYEDAILHFERALELDAGMQVAERNLQIAYFGTGYFERLVAELRERLDEDPDDVAALDRLGRAYLYTGDADAALQQWRQALQISPDDVRTLQQVARAEVRRGNPDAALTALRRAAELDPSHPRVLLQIGQALYQRGLGTDAREPLERAVARDPSLADAFHLLAFIYGDMGMEDAAQRASQRAAQLNPGYTKTEANLSLDSYSRARYEELIGDRTQRPGVAEGGTLAHYNLGLAFRQKALYDEALREFRLAAERGEDRFLVQQAQAEMLLLQGAGGEAEPVYRRLIEIESRSPKLWNELGVAHHQDGDLKHAADAYQRALDLDAEYALAANNLAVVTLHLGDADEAERSFRASLGVRPLADVWRNLGLMLHRRGRPGSALEAYREALDLDSQLVTAWAGLGEILLEQGKPAEARNALIRAVELDANFAEARYRLAFSLSALGDYQGAMRETRRALELNPYIPTPRFRLLIDLQFEEASVLAPELDVAERVDDSGIEAFDFDDGSLDDLFSRADPTTAALASIERMPAPEVTLSVARAAFEAGDLDDAQMHAQRAERIGIDRVGALLLLGDIYLRRSLAGEAVERYLAALDEASLHGEDTEPVRHALLGATRSLLALDKNFEALSLAERLHALSDGDPVALRTYGEALLANGRGERAVAVFEQVHERGAADVPLLTMLGSALRTANRLDDAERALRDAVALDDFAVGARVALAHVLRSRNDTEAAAAELAAALEVLPSYGEAVFALVDLELERGRKRAALHALVDLLSLDPYHLDGLVRLGELLTEIGRTTEAAVAYRRVLHFDPGHTRALGGLERLTTSRADDRPATAGAAGFELEG